MSPKKQKTKKVSVETERERVKGEITSWWNKWLSEEQDREEEDTVALGFIWADWAAQSGRAQKHIVSEAASAMNHENDPWTPWYTMTQWRCDTYHDRGWGGLGLLQSHTKVYFLTLLQSCLESLSLVPKAIFTNMPRIYLFLPLDELMLHDVILSSIFSICCGLDENMCTVLTFWAFWFSQIKLQPYLMCEVQKPSLLWQIGMWTKLP